MLCSIEILGNKQPQDSGQMANVAYLPRTQNANISEWLNGDDLNPPCGHGNTALIVVGGPWTDRDSRKNGSGKAVHMAKGSSKSVNTRGIGRCERLHERSDHGIKKSV